MNEKKYDILYCEQKTYFDEYGYPKVSFCRYMTRITAENKEQACDIFYRIYSHLSFITKANYIIENVSEHEE